MIPVGCDRQEDEVLVGCEIKDSTRPGVQFEVTTVTETSAKTYRRSFLWEVRDNPDYAEGFWARLMSDHPGYDPTTKTSPPRKEISLPVSISHVDFATSIHDYSIFLAA